MVDNLGERFGLEAAFPGGDEGSRGDDLARRVDCADVFEDTVGDRINGLVGHKIINALNAGIGKSRVSYNIGMSIILHIMDATGTLAPYKKVITETFDQAIAKITKILPIDEVDVVIRDNTAGVVPEIGLGGYTYGQHFLMICLDSKRGDCKQVIVNELLGVLAHELHHAKRFQTVGYEKGILGAMIFEGLATHFEREMTGVVPPWATALSKKQSDQWLAKAKKEFDVEQYDHHAWFFGSKGKKIPRWTGYTLGYQIVGDYLHKHPGEKASELYTKKAVAFIK